MALTDEEREFIQLGKLAEELKAHPGWSAYLAACASLRAVKVAAALQPGTTEFEKGAVNAIDLVLTCLDATIERREELLARERQLAEETGEDDDELTEEQSEKVP